MIILYLMASLVGAAVTVAALAPTGWLVAILCAPLGGSALTLATGIAVACARSAKHAATGSGRVSAEA